MVLDNTITINSLLTAPLDCTVSQAENSGAPRLTESPHSTNHDAPETAAEGTRDRPPRALSTRTATQKGRLPVLPLAFADAIQEMGLLYIGTYGQPQTSTTYLSSLS